MRHKKNTAVLDRKTGPRKALIRTLSISLIEQQRIQTTPTKARVVKSMVEKLITKGKEKNVHTIRYIESILANKKAALTVVNTLAPRFKERAGGYTTMVKVAKRKGDGAEQVILEFISDDKS